MQGRKAIENLSPQIKAHLSWLQVELFLNQKEEGHKSFLSVTENGSNSSSG